MLPTQEAEHSLSTLSPPASRHLREFTVALRAGKHLSRRSASALLDCLLAPGVTDAEISGALCALADKGETAEEVTGIALGLRGRMVAAPVPPGLGFVDTAGMGASRVKSFNVSTAAAIVASAAGIAVAKHGNGAASSRSGSADVMRALGATLPVTPRRSVQMLADIGFCFLYAPAHHPALARLAAVRRTVGVRTVFNLVGPLSNPAGAKRHLLGAPEARLQRLLAEALRALGTERAWVVSGSDGLDEITLSGVTSVISIEGNTTHEFDLSPEDFGLRVQSLNNVRAADAEQSARMIADIFAGGRGGAHDLVVINAAAAMHVGGYSTSLVACANAAASAIADGRAARQLQAFINASQEVRA